jgi:hypothetical protein
LPTFPSLSSRGLLVVLASLSCATAGFAADILVNDGLAIYDYTPGGAKTTFSTQTTVTFNSMAFDSAGDLFVAARDSNAIYEFTPGGVRSLFATVSSPYGMAIDSSGNIYTGANNASTLEKFAPGGGAPTVVATGLDIQSLASDTHGNIFDNNDGAIYEFSSVGTKTTFATGAPVGIGIAVDSSGNVYVGDWTNFTIDRSNGGAFTTFASLPTNQLPTNMAFDANGTLFAGEVADGSSVCCNQDVYTFSTSGIRSTFATGLDQPYGLAIQQSPAPEPASLALLGTALLFLGFRRRKEPAAKTAGATSEN